MTIKNRNIVHWVTFHPVGRVYQTAYTPTTVSTAIAKRPMAQSVTV